MRIAGAASALVTVANELVLDSIDNATHLRLSDAGNRQRT